MPLGLRDLLERIRPAGAPGAPADGARPADHARSAELAEVRALLEELDAAADAIVDAGRRRADELEREALAEARSIRAALPDRIARIAESDTGSADDLARSELDRLAGETARSIEQRRLAVETHGDEIVRAALDVIWSAARPDGDARQ